MKITINNMTWSVVFVSQNDMPIKHGNEELLSLGYTSYGDLKIYINKDVDEQVMHKSLIHELTHAYISSFGFTFVTMTEEIICEFMSYYSTSINQLLKAIVEQLEKE